MVELEILTGTKAGATWVARRFPVRVGRASTCDLQLEEHGVWNEHFRIDLSPDNGFVLSTQQDALVTASGRPVQSMALRNGDVVEIGALKLRFWLAKARQRGLALTEWLVWLLVAAVVLGEAALVYWLPR